MRFLLYSHDSFGLGHLRRSITLGQQLLASGPDVSVCLVTGSPVAGHWTLPAGLDVLELPTISKDSAGRYESRAEARSLPELVRVRSARIANEVRRFKPHVILVDHKPAGLLNEMGAAFEVAREVGARCVLGLRDIVDDPAAVESEWRAAGASELLESQYDAVLVYGDRGVYDATKEVVPLGRIGARVHFTGYVARPAAGPALRPFALLRPHVVVTVGGGEDGAERVELYLESLRYADASRRSTLVLGPLFDGPAADRIRNSAARFPGVTVLGSCNDVPALFRESSAVVSMAGYNTSVELLQARVPSVLLPRTSPRREQWIRARRFADLGFAQIMDGSDPVELNDRVETAVRSGRLRTPLPDMGGRYRAAARLVALAAESGLPMGAGCAGTSMGCSAGMAS